MTQVTSKNSLPDLIEEYMQAYFEANPVTASGWLGLHRYDGLLPDLSPESFTRRAAALKDMQRRVEQLPLPADKESQSRRGPGREIRLAKDRRADPRTLPRRQLYYDPEPLNCPYEDFDVL